jgi:hypothetical protein
MVKRKSRMEIRVADGAGGMMKVEDRRFEKGEWPISFEVSVTNEQADRWSRYLNWSCHRRGWTASKFGQVERAENSGTIAITANGKSQIDVVWEQKREGPLAVRARRVSSADISPSDAEQFFTEVNDICRMAATVPLYVRGTLQYEGRAWRGEVWLDDRTRLAAPSLQDETATYGPRIVHIDAILDCVGEPDIVYARQQMLIEMSAFLSVVMRSAVRQLDTGRVWTFAPGNTTSEVRSLGYLEPANPLSMPARGALKQVPFYGLDDPPWSRPDNEIAVRADITDLWNSYRTLSEKQRLQFLKAAAKWQEAMIHWQDRPSLSFALMAVACEALKPSDAGQRQNCYAVIEALLGKTAVERVRQNPFPAQHVRSTHLHSGEIHGSELMMMDFMRTYEDPSFREAHREMARVTPDALVAWLIKRGVFVMPDVGRQRSGRRWVRENVVIAVGLLIGLLP